MATDLRTEYEQVIHVGVVPLDLWRQLERMALRVSAFARKQLQVRAVFAGTMYAARPVVTLLDDLGQPIGNFFGREPISYLQPMIETRFGPQPHQRVQIRTPEDLAVWREFRPDVWPAAAG